MYPELFLSNHPLGRGNWYLDLTLLPRQKQSGYLLGCAERFIDKKNYKILLASHGARSGVGKSYKFFSANNRYAQHSSVIIFHRVSYLYLMLYSNECIIV